VLENGIIDVREDKYQGHVSGKNDSEWHCERWKHLWSAVSKCSLRDANRDSSIGAVSSDSASLASIRLGVRLTSLV
jgi:hypothetical protein